MSTVQMHHFGKRFFIQNISLTDTLTELISITILLFHDFKSALI